VNQHEQCSHNKPTVVIVVPSAVGNFKRRNKVRSGNRGQYARNNPKEAILLFFVGTVRYNASDEVRSAQVEKDLTDEMKIYGDIVIVDFEDVYSNILIKHLAMLQWVVTFCPGTEFVLRTDDDVGADTAKMVGALKRHHKERQDFILGKQHVGQQVTRNKKNAHLYVSRDAFKPDVWPPFVLGGAIGYPLSTVRLLLEAARRLPTVWLDDVFITGVCAGTLGIPTLNDVNFRFDH